MSKNRNRAKLKTAANNSNYRKIWINYEYPIYYDEGWSYYSAKKNMSAHNCKKRRILFYQVREYRTWKHNRKTQWK